MTWLYGPLHEHAEPVPPPKVASTQDRLDLDTSRMTKSILKHRTISEMLTTPGRSASPNMEFPPSVDASRETSDNEEEADSGALSSRSPGRPPIFAVRSDTNLNAKKRRTGGSPPASVRLMQNLDQASGSISERSNSSSNINGVEEKRHISFNQRVDQCIAVDYQEFSDDDDDGDEEGDDDDNDSDGVEYGSRKNGANETSEDDSPSSDDEVLTMKSSPKTSPSWPLTSTGPLISSRGSSPGSDHHTIAKLAPTLLKTSETFPGPSPAVVDPTGFKQLHFGANGEGNQPTLSSQSFGYDDGDDDNDASQTRYSQWDADDDFGGDFDYFNGPDMSDSYPAEREHVHQGSAMQSSTDDANEGDEPNDTEVGNNTQSSAAKTGPKSILKRRPIPSESDLAADSVAGDVDILGTSQPASAAQTTGAAVHSPREGVQSPTSPTSPGSPPPPGERGRPSQRLGSSASYERVMDAGRSGNAAATGVIGRGRSSSNGSIASSSASPTPAGSGNVSADESAVGSSSTGGNTGEQNSYRPTERRESFRGRAGDGAKAMGPGQQSSSASAPRIVRGPNQGQAALGTAVDSDSDGRGSFDFASPNYPASPLLGDRKEGETDGSEGPRAGGDGSDAKMYGRREDDSKWADEGSAAGGGVAAASPTTPVQAKKRSSVGGRKVRKQQAGDEQFDEGSEEHQRLSVDLGNLPRVDANKSPEAAPGGPTPLNTPTLALAKSRSARQRGGSTSSAGRSADEDSKAPPSPTIPRRSSATGALVAPSDADRDAGVRVPLAHDYVEEDEGGIVGRAVEIVNTARDLIGALLGTGGDRGRSWREAS